MNERFRLRREIAVMQTEINPAFMARLAEFRGIQPSLLTWMIDSGQIYTDWNEIKQLTQET